MNLGFSQQQKQVQVQKITASLIQSVEILQFSQAALEKFLAEQAQENPFLEVELPRDRADRAAVQARELETKAASPVEASARPSNQPATEAMKPDRPVSMEVKRGGAFDGISSLEASIAASPTLADHLRGQLGSAFKDPVNHCIAMEIIGSLDDDGYLRRDIERIADSLCISACRAEAVLQQIQQMDPAGVAARDLCECLRLQLEERGWRTPEMDLLTGNLALLANHDYKRLAAICQVDVNAVLAMARRIKTLDPRPGRRFDREPVVPALPDVLVRLTEDGAFVTELNSSVLPRVLVNGQYCSEVRARCDGAEEARFVTDCVRNANWLVRSLDQRAQTVLRVATEIVLRQKMFLLHGVEKLKPMNLKDVADAVGIHPSTVSRAIANKYMMTHRGLFEFGYFFANPVPASGGKDDVSSESVRHAIRQLIATEKDDVLSDDAIVHRLRTDGVNIARRTVAKYREGMNIPSSQQRRRLKAARAEQNGMPPAD